MSQLGRDVRNWFGRVMSPVILVGGLALFAGAAGVKAQDWEDCNQQMAYAKGQLHEAIEDNGYYSQQANYWRHEVQEIYERCTEQNYESNRGQNYPGNYPGYDRRNDGGYDQGGYREEHVDAALQRGYRDGQAAGYHDGRARRQYRPESHDEYEDGDRGYHREYGERNYYKQQYREGFLRGYQNGYYSR